MSAANPNERPAGRRFWVYKDVMEWLKVNQPDDHEARLPIWWVCYRDAEMLIDDTVRHIAQTMMDGIEPYDETAVDDKLQSWPNDEGDIGDLPGIDDAIEADLIKFFKEGR